jgi:hypothetical protein
MPVNKVGQVNENTYIDIDIDIDQTNIKNGPNVRSPKSKGHHKDWNGTPKSHHGQHDAHSTKAPRVPHGIENVPTDNTRSHHKGKHGGFHHDTTQKAYSGEINGEDASKIIAQNFSDFDLATDNKWHKGQDGVVAECDLEAVASDNTGRYSDAEVAAAKYMLDNPDEMNELNSMNNNFNGELRSGSRGFNDRFTRTDLTDYGYGAGNSRSENFDIDDGSYTNTTTQGQDDYDDYQGHGYNQRSGYGRPQSRHSSPNPFVTTTDTTQYAGSDGVYNGSDTQLMSRISSNSKLIAALDRNRDGKIDSREYTAWISKFEKTGDNAAANKDLDRLAS